MQTYCGRGKTLNSSSEQMRMLILEVLKEKELQGGRAQRRQKEPELSEGDREGWQSPSVRCEMGRKGCHLGEGGTPKQLRAQANGEVLSVRIMASWYFKPKDT